MTRPHPDKMLPYEWIYWELRDNGQEFLADAVRHLLADFRFAQQELRESEALRLKQGPPA